MQTNRRRVTTTFVCPRTPHRCRLRLLHTSTTSYRIFLPTFSLDSADQVTHYPRLTTCSVHTHMATKITSMMPQKLTPPDTTKYRIGTHRGTLSSRGQPSSARSPRAPKQQRGCICSRGAVTHGIHHVSLRTSSDQLPDMPRLGHVGSASQLSPTSYRIDTEDSCSLSACTLGARRQRRPCGTVHTGSGPGVTAGPRPHDSPSNDGQAITYL